MPAFSSKSEPARPSNGGFVITAIMSDVQNYRAILPKTHSDRNQAARIVLNFHLRHTESRTSNCHLPLNLLSKNSPACSYRTSSTWAQI